MTKMTKIVGNSICGRPQRVIRYATEPVALTGRQACQTSSFRFVLAVRPRLTSHMM
jgi:hypothetical protein